MDSYSADHCCVPGCRSKQPDQRYSFFPIPKAPARRAAWLNVIGRNDLIDSDVTRYRVCSKHFESSVITKLVLQKLKPNAVPTENIPNSPLINENDEGVSDMATQTDPISYGDDNEECDEEEMKEEELKKEKGPEKPN